MEDIAKLLGSSARVKLLRLFVFNPEELFDKEEVMHRARVSASVVAKELQVLTRIGLLEKKNCTKVEETAGGKKKRKAVVSWVLHKKYPLFDALRMFLENTLVISEKNLRTSLKGVGSIHLLVLAGFLVGEQENALDMLVVGDKLDEGVLEKAVRLLEAECGKEIRYALLSTDEYYHRKRVRDKLIRDVMDFSHRTVIDKVVGA